MKTPPAYLAEGRAMLLQLEEVVEAAQLQRLQARLEMWERQQQRKAALPTQALPPLVMRTSGIPTPLDSRYFILSPL